HAGQGISWPSHSGSSSVRMHSRVPSHRVGQAAAGGGAARSRGAGGHGVRGGSRVRAVADRVVETAGQRVPTAVAAAVEFAVGQLLGRDTSFGALPAVLEKLADTFHG